MKTEQVKEVHRRLHQQREAEFDEVKSHPEKTLKAISEVGRCEHIFTKLGTTVLTEHRQCEREKGHTGAHMFGLWRLE